MAQLSSTTYSTAKVLLRRELAKPARAYAAVAERCQYTHRPEAEVSRALNELATT